MANVNAVGVGAPQFNQSFNRTVTVTLATALAQNDTLTVTLPDGFSDSAIPILATVHSAAVPGVPLPLTITSHNVTTGVTIITSTGATSVAIGRKVIILYADA